MGNSFIIGTDRLVIVFRTEKARNDIKKLITKNKIFGPNITVSNAGKKPFVFYAKIVPKSYNEKFIAKRISENYNTETEIKILKGPENRKTNTIRITTNNTNNLKIALE